ncbi:tropomyosin-like [Ptychodera flava]|uniref:tropomyosin-like n=1 Tax=Ptychodera flava TaxID=63121 RepID=UPI00396A63E4
MAKSYWQSGDYFAKNWRFCWWRPESSEETAKYGVHCCASVAVRPGVLAVKLSLALLLVMSGDVEQNPGPPRLRSSEEQLATKQDVTNILQKLETLINDTKQMNNKLDQLQTRMDNMEDELHELKENSDENNSKINDIEETQTELKKTVTQLVQENEKLKQEKDDLENRSRRNNLIFYGVAQDDKQENWITLELKVREVIN